ncbi:QRFP-like peptide receptor [Glandiceps talaboti]
MAFNSSNTTVLPHYNTSNFPVEINDTDVNIPDRRPKAFLISPEMFIGIISVDCVLIIGGNLLVIIAVFRQPILRKSATNHLIISLAFSDLAVGAIFGPAQIVYTVFKYLSLSSEVLCDLLMIVMYTGLNSTIFTLMAIAADRYRAIIQPFKPKMTVKQARYITILVWLVSLCYSSYNIKVNGIVTYHLPDNSTIHMCTSIYSVMMAIEKPMSIVNLAVTYIIPLSIIAYLYLHMISSLYFTSSLNDESKRRKRKAIRMLLLVVVLFAICWGPLRVHQVMVYHFNDKIKFSSLFFTVVTFLFFANSWANPIIYAFFNDKFRKEFAVILTCGVYKIKNPTKKPNQSTVSTSVSEIQHNGKKYTQNIPKAMTAKSSVLELHSIVIDNNKIREHPDTGKEEAGIDNQAFEVNTEASLSERKDCMMTDSGVDLEVNGDTNVCSTNKV